MKNKNKNIKPILFPQDEQAHNTIIEWWYFNGHLLSSTKQHFTIMACLFKADPIKVKIPFLSAIPLKTVYFIHTIISDVASGKVFIDIKPINLAEKNSFKNKLLYLNTGGYRLEESSIFNYQFDSDYFSLNLESVKKPMLENQSGYLDLKVKNTYYYSQTNISADGYLNLQGKKIKVSGKMWLDHQWADCGWQPQDDKWHWFSVQLDNNIEIVCFEYGGKIKTKMATIMNSDGTQNTTDNIKFIPANHRWKSPATGAIYQLGWKIFIPDFNVIISVSPMLDAQEILFGLINYWEGGTKISANFNGKIVNGQGFLEIAGVPIKKEIGAILERQITTKIKNIIQKFFIKYFIK